MSYIFFFCMIRRPPMSTRPDTRVPYTTLFRSGEGGGPIDVDPAFTALREARDETGADLVSLVRAFRTPENAGCGIVWLIGGDETGIIQADEPLDRKSTRLNSSH